MKLYAFFVFIGLMASVMGLAKRVDEVMKERKVLRDGKFITISIPLPNQKTNLFQNKWTNPFNSNKNILNKNGNVNNNNQAAGDNGNWLKFWG